MSLLVFTTFSMIPAASYLPLLMTIVLKNTPYGTGRCRRVIYIHICILVRLEIKRKLQAKLLSTLAQFVEYDLGNTVLVCTRRIKWSYLRGDCKIVGKK